jgi:hypothetical protein
MNKLIVVLVALFVAMATAQTFVTPGITYSSSTPFRSWNYFALRMSESTINYVQLNTKVTSGTPFYYINVDSYPTFQTNIWKYENVTGGSVTKYIYNPNIDLRTGNYTNSILYVGIYGYSNTKYSIVLNAQGPITLYDRQALSPSFPIPNTYLFYKFYIDSGLRSFQAVVTQNYAFYMSNSTSFYPVYYNKYQYSSTSTYIPGSGYYTCLKLNYPYPGTYRLAVSVNPSNYTIQFVQNGLGTCNIE